MYRHTHINVLSFCYINKPVDIIHMQYVIRVLSVVFDWQLNQLGVTARLCLTARFFFIRGPSIYVKIDEENCAAERKGTIRG